jgi:hypothetical protein
MDFPRKSMPEFEEYLTKSSTLKMDAAGSSYCSYLSTKLRGGADKYLARPGRKQATATEDISYL